MHGAQLVILLAGWAAVMGGILLLVGVLLSWLPEPVHSP